MYPVEKMCKAMKTIENAHYYWFKNKDILFCKTPIMVLK